VFGGAGEISNPGSFLYSRRSTRSSSQPEATEHRVNSGSIQSPTAIEFAGKDFDCIPMRGDKPVCGALRLLQQLRDLYRTVTNRCRQCLRLPYITAASCGALPTAIGGGATAKLNDQPRPDPISILRLSPIPADSLGGGGNVGHHESGFDVAIFPANLPFTILKNCNAVQGQAQTRGDNTMRRFMNGDSPAQVYAFKLQCFLFGSLPAIFSRHWYAITPRAQASLLHHHAATGSNSKASRSAAVLSGSSENAAPKVWPYVPRSFSARSEVGRSARPAAMARVAS
jgi:hypothetical protein